jgi:phosphoglycerate dehydrogenase-like enzyme
MPRVLTSVHIEFKGRSPATEMMEQTGIEVIAQPPRPGWPDDETLEKLVGIDGLLAGSENLNASTLDQADSLKIIARNAASS